MVSVMTTGGSTGVGQPDARVWREAFVICVSIVLVTVLHYATDTKFLVLHEAFQRFYYLPIIFAAYRYGVRGGLATSLFSAAIYVPHMFFHWEDLRVYALSQYWEMALFQVVAVVTGLLSNAGRRERRKSEEAARALAVAYAELKATVEQLVAAERMASIAQLSLSLVHEVRNPLGAIRGATEAVETCVDPGEAREFLGIIHTEVNRLNRLVSDFLEYGRPRPPEKLPTHANEVVESVIALVKKRAAEQGVAIHRDLGENLPVVPVDSEQIKQALFNLALNGLDAMPDGGTLAFATVAEGDAVTVTVSDTGKGVAPSVKENLFRPFLTTKARGTGLGLAISERLVSQNGGTVSLVTSNRPGTAFQVKLPS